MDVDENLLQQLGTISQNQKDAYVLHYEDKTFPIDMVTISKSTTPVRERTKRGGVYFADKLCYKMKATTTDHSIMNVLSNAMLGPNVEFSEIEITTDAEIQGKTQKISLFTNLTNSMQDSSMIELNMIIIGTKIN